MKVQDILNLIEDSRLYIRILEYTDLILRGEFTKSDLIYNTKFKNAKIKFLNVQYLDGKRTLVLYI